MGQKKGINSAQLKWIAIITMLLDHVGLVYRQQIYGWIQSVFGVRWPETFYVFGVLFLLGRIAFPLFAFQVAEGVRHTRSPGRYLSRLFMFGVLSEIPFRWMVGLVTDINSRSYFTNVMFTLFLAVLACVSCRGLLKRGLPQIVCLLPACALALLADWLHTDYGATGVLLVLVLFLTDDKKRKLYVVALWSFINYGMALLDPAAYQVFDWFKVLVPLLYFGYALLSLPVIIAYNGKKGQGPKYVYYLFYPVHLWLLMLLAAQN